MMATEWLVSAQEALQHGNWRAARSAAEESLALEESPEALETLGTACWWQDDQHTVLDTRERAFRLYRERGDPRSAARLATALAIDYADYRGDFAVGSGWLLRAGRLLQGVDAGLEHGWLALYQGFFALMYDNDLVKTREYRQAALDLLPLLKDINIEMMAVALEGLTLIREGKLTLGMRHLDEAMAAAVGGEMSDLAAIGTTCCSLIYACEAVADYDRAHQWCDRTREFCRRLGLDAFFAICRNYYATVLIWNGAWDEADAELSAALSELQANRPGYAQDSLAKLGELRRRQGRLQEAESYFERAEPNRRALLGKAALALDRGEAAAAIDLLDRVLRRVGEEDQAERVFALEMLVRATIAARDLDTAEHYLAMLESAAVEVGTQPLLATSKAGRAAYEQSRGRLENARRLYEDAIDLFEATGADFDSARLRIDYASVFLELGRTAGALGQALTAQTSFRRLGAMHYAEQASKLVAQLSAGLGKPPTDGNLPHGLTPREAEVLWLIAAGRTNQDIAEELVLSVRTVERHISTIYEKLQLHGRAARASAAALAVGLQQSNT
jgi:LuxR family transcriptional regulator, maltose regulon positive regulatory protein